MITGSLIFILLAYHILIDNIGNMEEGFSFVPETSQAICFLERMACGGSILNEVIFLLSELKYRDML